MPQGTPHIGRLNKVVVRRRRRLLCRSVVRRSVRVGPVVVHPEGR